MDTMSVGIQVVERRKCNNCWFMVSVRDSSGNWMQICTIDPGQPFTDSTYSCFCKSTDAEIVEKRARALAIELGASDE